MVQRRHMARRSSSTRRKLVWADSQGFSGTPLGLAGSGANFDLLSTYRGSGGSTQGVTIIRTHLTMGAGYTPTTSVTPQEGIDVGLIVSQIDEQQNTLRTDKPNFDWMLFKTFYAMQGNSQWNNAAGTPQLVTAYEIDLRAKRKCQEIQETLFLSTAARTAVTTEFWYHARILLALP